MLDSYIHVVSINIPILRTGLYLKTVGIPSEIQNLSYQGLEQLSCIWQTQHKLFRSS